MIHQRLRSNNVLAIARNAYVDLAQQLERCAPAGIALNQGDPSWPRDPETFVHTIDPFVHRRRFGPFWIGDLAAEALIAGTRLRPRHIRNLLALDARRSCGRAWWDQFPSEYQGFPQGFPRRYPSLGDAAVMIARAERPRRIL